MNKNLIIISLISFSILFNTCTKVKKEMRVTTGEVTNILVTTADAPGNIIDLGEGIVTQYGHCYGTHPNVSIADSKTQLGKPLGQGGFTSQLSGLESNTKYYIKAYITDGVKPVYSDNELTFTTKTGSVSDAPIIGTATAGNAQASVSFTAPTNNGGSAITAYTVTSNPGSLTGTGNSSPITVTGLTNGTSYTFTVTASNASGISSASSASNSVTPSAPPDAPIIGSATSGNNQATVTFTPPVNNGGSAITGYTVTSNPGSISANGSSSPITVTGLTNGTTYTFTVTATNANGTSSPSSVSNSVIPVPPMTPPDAPTIGTAIAENAQATINFTPPSNNGGSPITAYTVTSSPDNISETGSANPITITGLTNGTAYTFTVTATNAIGTSTPSSASNSVIPSTVPDAPIIGTASAGNAQATISFTAPANNGGSAITEYSVTSNPGGLIGTGTVSPIIVTGLTNGTEYTFTVTATNSAGTSSPCPASNSVIPSTVPDAPTIGTASAGDTQATVTFTSPSSDGGSAITEYTVTSNPENLTGSGSSSPITVTGLTNGTSYTFKVTATNANGPSSSSSASNAVIPIPSSTVPDAPIIGIATAGDAQATVTFTTPASDGGSAITGYTVTSNPGGITKTGSASPITVTGLTNGTTYTFTATATNAIGPSLPSSASNSVTPLTPPLINQVPYTDVHDNDGDGGVGNGDGKINVAEEIDLEVAITNNGNRTAYNITGTLSINDISDNSYCNITDSEEYITLLAVGQNIELDDFDFVVTGMPSDGTLNFKLTVNYEDESGNSFSNVITGGFLDLNVYNQIFTPTLVPDNDAFVSSLSPDGYYNNTLLLVENSTEIYYSYIKFASSDLPPSGSSLNLATLRLYCAGSAGTSVNVSIYLASGNWSEGSITWNNQPGFNINFNTYFTVTSTGKYYEINIKKFVEEWVANGNYGLVLRFSNGPLVYFNSSEATSNKPELLLEYE